MSKKEKTKKVSLTPEAYKAINLIVSNIHIIHILSEPNKDIANERLLDGIHKLSGMLLGACSQFID